MNIISHLALKKNSKMHEHSCLLEYFLPSRGNCYNSKN